jgi:hypothetical protein
MGEGNEPGLRRPGTVAEERTMKLWTELKRWYRAAMRRARDAEKLPTEASEKGRKLAVERDAKLIGLHTPNGG